MTVPRKIRASIKAKLWEVADQLEWNRLGQTEKARYYEVWTKASEIGEQLSRYMDGGHVRVYIKDTLLKDYGRAMLADPHLPLTSLGLDGDLQFDERYIKPHGRRLEDGRVLCWGRADDWKSILMSVHERAFCAQGTPFAAVLMRSSGRYHDLSARAVVEDAARRLVINRVVWLD